MTITLVSELNNITDVDLKVRVKGIVVIGDNNS